MQTHHLPSMIDCRPPPAFLRSLHPVQRTTDILQLRVGRCAHAMYPAVESKRIDFDQLGHIGYDRASVQTKNST